MVKRIRKKLIKQTRNVINNENLPLQNNTIIEQPGIIGSSTGFNVKPTDFPHDLIYKINENPDTRFNRGVIPANPNKSYFDLLAMGALVGTGMLVKKIFETKGSNIVNNLYAIGGQELIGGAVTAISAFTGNLPALGVKAISLLIPKK
jgi:hypothetical protein